MARHWRWVTRDERWPDRVSVWHETTGLVYAKAEWWLRTSNAPELTMDVERFRVLFGAAVVPPVGGIRKVVFPLSKLHGSQPRRIP